MEMQCKKCRRMKPIEEFPKTYLLRNGKTVRKKTCYDCHYRNHIHKCFCWETATKQQILDKLEKRLNKYVVKQEGCWDWNGFVRPDGYTRMRFGFHTNKKSVGGHVISWMIYKKDIDIDKYCKSGLYILHYCDNRKCCNPKHLFVGTSRDNMIDASNKGRLKSAKLRYRQVVEIKKMLKEGIRPRYIARQYKVHEATIGDIKKGITWKHVVID